MGWEAYDYNGPRAREKQMSSSNDFGVDDHASFQHPTQHNLSPVEGEHDVYAKHYAKKADWHYQRWGNPKQPQASLAKAGLYDFRSKLAKNWPK